MGLLARNARRAAIAAAGAFVARATCTALARSSVRTALERTNHRGHTVSLAEGPAATLGASVASAAGARNGSEALAALTVGLGSGAVGLYDDMVDTRPHHDGKGLQGHFRALMQGRVTSGAVKVVGAGTLGLAGAFLIDRRSANGRISKYRSLMHTALGAGLIAGSANLMNLFDLRPGRALKVTMAVASPLSNRDDFSGRIAVGTASAAGALMSDDLAGTTMLGDCGANALGAMIGMSLAARSGPLVRGVLLGGVTALTLTSERVSFTKVIADTPILRELDELGRR
ncbi:MAG TPA: hypothetical protein H9902_03815 [Candidatus Stackebrandtia faecavium]|nr:hypothetical protein [Candidatus Stackebrandtia faecavium]